MDIYKRDDSDLIVKKAYWTVFGKFEGKKIKQKVLNEFETQSVDQLLENQNDDTLKSLIGFFKLFSDSKELESWFN